MNRKKAYILTFISILLFLLSLTQEYYFSHGFVHMSYDLVLTWFTLISVSIYTFALIKNEYKLLKLSSILLSTSYFLVFHMIYTTESLLEGSVLFLWIKEVLIPIVLYGIFFLKKITLKEKEKVDLRKIVKLALVILPTFVIISIFVDRIIEIRLGLYLYIFSFIFYTISLYFSIREEKPSD